MRRVSVMQKKYLGICPTTRKAIHDFEHRPAFFHAWGVSSCEDSDGNMTDSYAIVEYDDGTVELVEPHMIKFLDRRNDEKTEPDSL